MTPATVNINSILETQSDAAWAELAKENPPLFQDALPRAIINNTIPDKLIPAVLNIKNKLGQNILRQVADFDPESLPPGITPSKPLLPLIARLLKNKTNPTDILNAFKDDTEKFDFGKLDTHNIRSIARVLSNAIPASSTPNIETSISKTQFERCLMMYKEHRNISSPARHFSPQRQGSSAMAALESLNSAPEKTTISWSEFSKAVEEEFSENPEKSSGTRLVIDLLLLEFNRPASELLQSTKAAQSSLPYHSKSKSVF